MAKSAFAKLVSAMLPNTSRDLLVRKLEKELDIMGTHTLKRLELIDELATNSGLYVKVQRELDKQKNVATRGKVIGYLRDITVKRVEERRVLEDIVSKRFKNDQLKEALEYDAITLLLLVNCIQFYNMYVIRLVSTLVHIATSSDNSPLSKAYMDFVGNSDNMRAFAIITNTLSKKFKDIGGYIEKMQGISFNDETDDVMLRMNASKLNPMGLGFLPLEWNPLYNLLEIAVALEGKRIRYLEEDLVRYQFILRRLQQQRSDGGNKDLDNQIEYYEDLVYRLDKTLQEHYDGMEVER